MIVGILGGDPSPPLTNHDCKFSFVVERVVLGRADQRSVMPRKAAREPGKQRHVLRLGAPVLILSIPIGEIHTNA